MKVRLLKIWDNLRASYWFIPSMMTLGAIILSFVLTILDARIGAAWMEEIGWLYANQPAGARELLSTIAGSMITVAGVVFSITIVALAHASSQFGPRLLTNFMRDRGNQITLGTFIATFIYCLLVLRTIHSPELDDMNGTAMAAEAFVPQIAVLAGMGLALASIGVLIFFLHHIPESIHASNVTANVGRELNSLIKQTFPERVGKGQPVDEISEHSQHLPDDFSKNAVAVQAESSGYLQHLDLDHLVKLGEKHDLIFDVLPRPGTFITEGQALTRVGPGERVDAEVISNVQNAFAWGRQQTQHQDLLFLVTELVEIASRALSTGVNDPFTAMTCMDWLGSALVNLSDRNLPGRNRYDSDRQLRVVAPRLNYSDFAEAAFEPMRPYVQEDRNAALHMMRVIADVTQHAPSPETRKLMLGHAENLKEGCERHLEHTADLEAVRQEFRNVVQRVHTPEEKRRRARAETSHVKPGEDIASSA